MDNINYKRQTILHQLIQKIDVDKLKDDIIRELLAVENRLIYFQKEILPRDKQLFQCWHLNNNNITDIRFDTDINPVLQLLIKHVIEKCVFRIIVSNNHNFPAFEYQSTISSLISLNRELLMSEQHDVSTNESAEKLFSDWSEKDTDGMSQ